MISGPQERSRITACREREASREVHYSKELYGVEEKSSGVGHHKWSGLVVGRIEARLKVEV